MKSNSLRSITLAAGLGLGLGATASHASAQWHLDAGVSTSVQEDFVLRETVRVPSPVDSVLASAIGDASRSMDRFASEAQLQDLGTTVEVDFPPGSWLASGDEIFRLVHIHLHTPAVASHADEAQPVVAHFVHAMDDGELGVLGVTLDTGSPAAGLAPLVAALEHATADGEVIALEIDPDALRPDEPEFLCHMGSLTVPPCTAGAHWRLYEQVIDAGPAQRTAMRMHVDPLASPEEVELPDQQPAPAVR